MAFAPAQPLVVIRHPLTYLLARCMEYRALALLPTLVVFLALSLSSCGQTEPTKDGALKKPLARSDIPSEAIIVLDELNGSFYEPELIDAVENPDLQEGFCDDGTVGGWVFPRKLKLKELGFLAQWNRERMVYELYILPDNNEEGEVRKRPRKNGL